jgi:D-alanyl-D-alanine dipeptidase
MKPYQQVPVVECGEPLVTIQLEQFAVVFPHPYQQLGAPYGERSPYHLRQSVLDNLIKAQTNLQQCCPGWRIQIFDAYRPVLVQQFMVDHVYAEIIQCQGLNSKNLTESQHHAILQQVYQLWAIPSLDPKTPPPHSTGGAIDVTLVDDAGQTVFMGSPIDELSPRSHPDYFAAIANDPTLGSAEREQAYLADRNRQLLKRIMCAAGFQRHPGEWWHFCLGDQMWAWLTQQQMPENAVVACYGRI